MNALFSRKILRTLLVALWAMIVGMGVSHANVEIQKVTSPEGIVAWLMEDSNDEMVTISFAFQGGELQDPEGHEGLTSLMAQLLTTGAGELNRDEFQQRLYETGARFSFASSSEWVSGSLRVLPNELEGPLELVALALKAPRFDAEDIDQAKGVIYAALEDRKNDPDFLGSEKFAKAIYGEHPVARYSTAQSIGSISRDDLIERKNSLLTRANLYVGVAGNITSERLEELLSQMFGSLPEGTKTERVVAPSPKFGLLVTQVYQRPQTSFRMVYPGLSLADDHIYAGEVLAHILGGGMGSLLFTEIREKRGLTYGIYAGLRSYRDWGILSVVSNSKAENAAEALNITKAVIEDVAKGGITQEQVDQAKSYLKGSIVKDNLSSTSLIARTLVSMQLLGQPMDYIQKLSGYYEAVTLEDVKQVAEQLLSTKPSVLIVGQE